MAFINELKGDLLDEYSPQDGTKVGQSNLTLDPSKNLIVRGQMLTDETSFSDDFLGAALGADWTQSVSSGSISVGSSKVTIGSGTANASNPRITYAADYCPATFRGAGITISQRIANQTILFGFTYRVAGVIKQGAYFTFTGTDATKVTCNTISNNDGFNLQSTTANLVIGANTAQSLFYKIDVSNNCVSFLVRTASSKTFYLLAYHELHIPDPYQVLDIELSILNSAVVTNTNLVCDKVFFNNLNRIQIDDDFVNEPLPTSVNLITKDYFQSVANGEIDGVSALSISANNPSIAAAATSDIWTQSGVPTFTLLTTAVTHNIVSTAAVGIDGAAGTGARTVKITGLDANYNEQTETVTLNGVTNVLTTKLYLFISDMRVMTVGSGGVNAGTITATSTGGTVAVQCAIAIGTNLSAMAIYLVPAGFTAFIHNVTASFVNANNNSTATITLFEKPFGEPIRLREPIPLTTSSNNLIVQPYSPPLKMVEKTFFKWRCTASTNNTSANLKAGIILQQNLA